LDTPSFVSVNFVQMWLIV